MNESAKEFNPSISEMVEAMREEHITGKLVSGDMAFAIFIAARDNRGDELRSAMRVMQEKVKDITVGDGLTAQEKLYIAMDCIHKLTS